MSDRDSDFIYPAVELLDHNFHMFMSFQIPFLLIFNFISLENILSIILILKNLLRLVL